MILRVILLSLRNLRRRPYRTLLILQGVIWGTALGVVAPAVIEGSRKQVEENARNLGTDRLLISQDTVDVVATFNWDLVGQLESEYKDDIRHIIGIAPISDLETTRPVFAINPGELAARGLTLQKGRHLTDEDLRDMRPVCLIEAKAAHELFAGQDPLGKKLILSEKIEVEVIGVTEARSEGISAMDDLGYRRDHPLRGMVESFSRTMGYFEDRRSEVLRGDEGIMVPHSLFPECIPTWIEVRADPLQVIPLRDALRIDLGSRGYEPAILTNAVLPILYSKSLDTMLELHKVVFFLSIAVGTSVVGALMVISVMERRREIAIRRVEGARRWHIAVQFVVETGTVCFLGGLLGVPLGILLAIIRCTVDSQDSISWTFPVAASVKVVTIVSVVGLIGGLLPAWRAVKVDPVEMLRYE